MENKSIIIIGAGGHAKVIIDIIKNENKEIFGIFDDDEKKHGITILGVKVIGNIKDLFDLEGDFSFVIGIGDNYSRKKIADLLYYKGLEFAKAIHPSSIIGEDVEVGEGTVIMANTVINSGTRIGKHCIINTSVSIDHDNEIEDYVHFSPNSTTGGTVKVGSHTWVGLGTKIINNITIGQDVIIGAGSVIINDIKSVVLVVGVPGKIKKEL